jgi:hypothetical protein
MMVMMGWRATSFPLLEPLGPHDGAPTAEDVVGAAATKLAAAKRKAGMKERTRMVSEV